MALDLLFGFMAGMTVFGLWLCYELGPSNIADEFRMRPRGEPGPSNSIWPTPPETITPTPLPEDFRTAAETMNAFQSVATSFRGEPYVPPPMDTTTMPDGNTTLTVHVPWDGEATDRVHSLTRVADEIINQLAAAQNMPPDELRARAGLPPVLETRPVVFGTPNHAETIRQLVSIGMLSTNEARALLDLQPLPGTESDAPSVEPDPNVTSRSVADYLLSDAAQAGQPYTPPDPNVLPPAPAQWELLFQTENISRVRFPSLHGHNGDVLEISEVLTKLFQEGRTVHEVKLSTQLLYEIVARLADASHGAIMVAGTEWRPILGYRMRVQRFAYRQRETGAEIPFVEEAEMPQRVIQFEHGPVPVAAAQVFGNGKRAIRL